ncbi:MAG: hypothetical protein ACLP22_22405 [Solirubrobacteraceae bacterium]
MRGIQPSHQLGVLTSVRGGEPVGSFSVDEVWERLSRVLGR